jgi:DNA polymerase I-like protein with 3'-5' exonuclease and polymerase domains
LFSEEGLGLESKKKTPKGAPSTNEAALKLLGLPKQQSGAILAFDKVCKVWHNSPILVPKLR